MLTSLLLFAVSAAGFGQIVTYPAPPGLVTSPDFTVVVNGTPVWVERIGSPYQDRNSNLYGNMELEYLNVANFSCSGSMTFTVTASANIQSFIIRPKNRQIRGNIKGRQLTFSLPGPQKLYIEINGLAHLAIFANPLEVNPPVKGSQALFILNPVCKIRGKLR